jgi:putative membrane protein
MLRPIALALVVALSASPALAQSAKHEAAKAKLSKLDRSFATHAMSGGQLEVELGQAAERQAGSDAVRSFGQRMVQDHSANNQQLQAVAQRLGLSQPAQLPADERRQVDRLTALNGPDFDAAYMQQMVKDHEKDIKAFEKEARSGANPELKGYAQQSLPVLQQHLQLARQVTAAQNVAQTPRRR